MTTDQPERFPCPQPDCHLLCDGACIARARRLDDEDDEPVVPTPAEPREPDARRPTADGGVWGSYVAYLAQLERGDERERAAYERGKAEGIAEGRAETIADGRPEIDDLHAAIDRAEGALARAVWDAKAAYERGLADGARSGYDTAIATMRDIWDRTGSWGARWAADYLAADPDRRAPQPAEEPAKTGGTDV